MESDLPYIDPEVLASLKAVVIVGNKTNNDSDRAVVKNLVDASNPFIISNAAYKLNSGYGKYEVDFTTWSKRNVVTSNNDNSFSFESKVSSSLLYYSTTIGVDTPSFKIKANISNCLVYYYYINDKGTLSSISILESGEFELPISHNTLYNGNIGIGFEIGRINGTGTGTITQIPSYQGAFVTDGIDDLITSTKTVQEMGITDEVTVVSMIHQIDLNSTYTIATTNYIENSNSREHVRSDVYNYGKTGIYGYSASLINNTKSDIKNILGDEADYYVKSTNSLQTIFDAKFSVVGRISELTEASQVAWYWTIIANKVLTTDQINQVIAYFNLDKTLKPDMLCNITKQGITNDNHADFNDKLIDYSGNGRDIQMNNLAWKGGSGVAAKQYETFKDWTNTPYQTSTVTEIDEFTRVVDSTSNAYWVSMINRTSDFDKVHDSINIVLYQDDMLLIHECKYKIDENVTTKALYETLKSGVNTITLATIDKFTDIPEDAEIMSLGEWVNPKSNKGSVKITLLPSYKGGLLLDGVNDFGKVTGMPIYKDYTFIIDYERISYASSERWVAGVVSKSHVANQGAFILMTANTEVEPGKQAYSFGGVTSFNRDDFTRALLYQSKYKCGDVDLTVGEGVDSDTLWLGTFRSNDQRFFNGAIYSLMSFPYSMSEFLIERQLKKHKLGTLYPNMVEFRPVITSNVEYVRLDFYLNNYQKRINIGDYIPKDAYLRANFYLKNNVDELTVFTFNGVNIGYRRSSVDDTAFNINQIYNYDSPQEVNITIDEYIRYEDIVQPYPVLLRFNDENGNEVSWGGKFRVGSTITIIGSAADSNLLPNIYNIFGLLLNDNQVTSSKVIVEKTMVFKAKSAYIFDNNEPNCILSPRLLRIPNSSYKILGYIPDISGHGNHGVIHNSAYAEGSGVNEDGSYQFDGVDDFVTIPTVTGGKQVLMKVNWDSSNSALLYDQRGYNNEFAIYNGSADSDGNPIPAYSGRNNGQTYIDGILNSNIKASELRAITHNITITNELSAGVNKFSPVIGSNRVHNAYFTNMALYDFMLFDNISTDDKIKELNEYVGIEGNTEWRKTK